MVYLGADHNGFRLKEYLKTMLAKRNIVVVDLGPKRRIPNDDYPDIAWRVARAVLRRSGATGILVCGSGNGMVMAANRFRGIRAALAPSAKYARKAREDEDGNILVVPAWWVTKASAAVIVRQWLETPFSGAPRHRRRLKKLLRASHA